MLHLAPASHTPKPPRRKLPMPSTPSKTTAATLASPPLPVAGRDAAPPRSPAPRTLPTPQTLALPHTALAPSQLAQFAPSATAATLHGDSASTAVEPWAGADVNARLRDGGDGGAARLQWRKRAALGLARCEESVSWWYLRKNCRACGVCLVYEGGDGGGPLDTWLLHPLVVIVC